MSIVDLRDLPPRDGFAYKALSAEPAAGSRTGTGSRTGREAGFRLIQRATVVELLRDANRVAGLIDTTPDGRLGSVRTSWSAPTAGTRGARTRGAAAA